MIDTMIRQEEAAGSFTLEIHSIKSQNSISAAQDSHDDGPVQKFRTLLHVPSTIRVSVLAPSSDITCIGPLSQDAILKGGNKRSCREATVEMSAIPISSKDLCADPEQIAPTDSYNMMLSVEFTSRGDAKALYNYLGVETSDTSTYLSTIYGNILECPRERAILPLKASGKPVGIGLEVSMYWNTMPKESVLAQYNRQLKSTIKPSISYPTPPLDLEPRYKLTFIYGKETLRRSELVCLHCSKRKALDIHDLQMHLISWHEYFDYKVTNKGIDEDGVEHWRFQSEVADHRADQRQRASYHADKPCNVQVIAPAQPFDKRRFLKGDDRFQREARVEKTKPSPSVSVAPISTSRTRKTPDEVQSRPRRRKKKFPVPEPPKGVTFFRSFSKRPLEPGEEISESDDELDKEWMTQLKHAEFEKDKIPEAVSRFLKIFDAFMHDEHLHSIFHMGEAIIRFARQHGSTMWQDTTMSEFTIKLDELLEDDIITKDVHAAAFEIVEAQKPNTDANQLSQRLSELDVQQQKRPKLDRKGKGRAILTETGHITPITVAADSDGDIDMGEPSPRIPSAKHGDEDTDPPYDECYCGEDASATPGASGIIACINVDCIRRHFHISCIEHRSKPPPQPQSQSCLPPSSTAPRIKPRSWMCDECKVSSSVSR
ncbi:hypothetical protein TUN199_08472 [Pyrenophora tritici-repentis]|nr:hypothetical protein Alg215_08942 [Pyrenophora tritici-repentis]KAI0577424.1 hypothetical protein Alg130_08367 [Pyrenophora tritici-repentis]KAI0619527.1 hypothetical protein TUN199_08472 [Pyrenophora tritici-repentis]PZD23026.1 hypothetical protein A1F96_10618 [Pyrenophora tritici-repentis]PZD28492.1 hypothetical protein A1F97_10548 [Pyrenophora tritici-repentis]